LSEQSSFIELAGYERLRDQERRIWYSPVAIVLALVGLAGAGYAFYHLRGGLEDFPARSYYGLGVLALSYLALAVYYYGYRFRRVKCPSCDTVMRRYVADMDDGSWRRFIRAYERDGRYYREPFGEDDTRRWVRLMKVVRACPECRTYVDCARLHEQTCTEEELARLQLPPP
jgi:hypothetical protein